MTSFSRTQSEAVCLLVGAALAVTAPACSGKLDFSRLDEKTVAVVNGLQVSLQEIEQRYARLDREEGGRRPKDAREVESIKRAIVQELINRKLLLAEARRRGLAVPQAQVDRELSRMASGLAPEDFREALDSARLTAEDLRESIGEDLLIQRLVEAETGAIAVADKEAAEYYERNRSRFFQKESVRARQITVVSEEEARRLRRRLVAGEDFAALAAAVSVAPDGKRGGDLGFFERGQMPAQIEEAAFGLAVGALSQPVESPYGFHLIKVEEKRPPRQLELAEVRQRIAAEISAAKKEESYRELLSALMKDAKISFNRKYRQLAPELES